MGLETLGAIFLEAFAVHPVISTVAALGSAYGSAEISKSMGIDPVPPKPPAPPAIPDMSGAARTAQDALDARRRAVLASGGQTLLTGPGGSSVQPGQIQLKTLLGG